MSAEPVSLTVATVFAAVGTLLVVWFFARVALERRELARSRQSLLARVQPELHGKLDRVLAEVHLVRERAEAWARDDWYVSRQCVDALDTYRDQILASPTAAAMDEGIEKLGEIRAKFEAEPDTESLKVMAGMLRELGSES